MSDLPQQPINANDIQTLREIQGIYQNSKELLPQQGDSSPYTIAKQSEENQDAKVILDSIKMQIAEITQMVKLPDAYLSSSKISQLKSRADSTHQSISELVNNADLSIPGLTKTIAEQIELVIKEIDELISLAESKLGNKQGRSCFTIVASITNRAGLIIIIIVIVICAFIFGPVVGGTVEALVGNWLNERLSMSLTTTAISLTETFTPTSTVTPTPSITPDINETLEHYSSLKVTEVLTEIAASWTVTPTPHDTPDLTQTVNIIQEQIQSELTATATTWTATPTSSDTLTPSGTPDITQTIEAYVRTQENQNRTPSATPNQTETIAAALDSIQTATATHWTDTPTPDITQTIDNFLTVVVTTQVAGLTLTAEAWTETPTPDVTATIAAFLTAQVSPSPTPVLCILQVIETNGANVRSDTTTDETNVIEIVQWPAPVTVVGETGDWYEVITPQNRRGWMKKSLLEDIVQAYEGCSEYD